MLQVKQGWAWREVAEGLLWKGSFLLRGHSFSDVSSFVPFSQQLQKARPPLRGNLSTHVSLCFSLAVDRCRCALLSPSPIILEAATHAVNTPKKARVARNFGFSLGSDVQAAQVGFNVAQSLWLMCPLYKQPKRPQTLVDLKLEASCIWSSGLLILCAYLSA